VPIVQARSDVIPFKIFIFDDNKLEAGADYFIEEPAVISSQYLLAEVLHDG
jgi:hypothetical protein